jgi:5,10-methylenetetrahydromethanopterin reductase
MRVDIAVERACTMQEYVHLGALAERYGIATLWAPTGVASRDAFVSLSGLARSSNRIRLGVQAMSPFEMHPLRIASALLTLNELSAGRASILIGSGGAIFGSTGLKPVRPVRATRECIEILKGVSAERALSYPGEIFTVRNYRPEWATQSPPRILAGANRPQMLRMAARAADGILMSDMPLALVPGALAIVREARAEAGKSGMPYEFNNWWAWHVKEDRAEAVAEARSQIVLRGMLTRPYLEAFLSGKDCDLIAARMPAFYKAYRARSPVIEGVPEPLLEALVDNLTLTTDLDGLDAGIERLQAFEKAGLTHITLGLHGDLEAAIRIVGERVVPALI